MQLKTPERIEHKEMYPGICFNNGRFNYTIIVVDVHATFKQQLVLT
jgi:hypothetical protein